MGPVVCVCVCIEIENRATLLSWSTCTTAWIAYSCVLQCSDVTEHSHAAFVYSIHLNDFEQQGYGQLAPVKTRDSTEEYYMTTSQPWV